MRMRSSDHVGPVEGTGNAYKDLVEIIEGKPSFGKLVIDMRIIFRSVFRKQDMAVWT